MGISRESLDDISRTCRWLAVFLIGFVGFYLGVVLILQNVYTRFSGLLPESSPWALRIILYTISILSIVIGETYRKKRFRDEALKKNAQDRDGFVKYILYASAVSMLFAEVSLLCGFFLFFLRAMYLDFYILAGAAVIFILRALPPKARILRVLGE